MATSKYLNVYDPGQNVVNKGTIHERVDPNAKGAGQVVHDTQNNKFYGDQSLATMMAGMEKYIAQLSQQIETGGKMGTHNAGTMYETQVFQKFNDQMIADTQAQIEQTKNYMDMFGSRYEQSDKFFDSYDTYQQDWDNVFDARRRNTKIEGQNDVARQKNNELAQQPKQGSLAIEASSKPKKTINTGITSQGDQLMSALSNTGLGI